MRDGSTFDQPIVVSRGKYMSIHAEHAVNWGAKERKLHISIIWGINNSNNRFTCELLRRFV